MQALTDNPVVDAAAVEELITRFSEPAWLAEERRAALRSYDATPFPTARDEQWRYSHLDRFTIDGLGLIEGPLSDVVSERISMRSGDSDAEGTMVIKNGKLVERQAKLAEQGVIFTDLRTAVREHEALVREHLFSTVNATQTKYTALNSALWTNGTFVYVPKDVEVELPLGTFTTADRGGIGAGRTLIVVDVNAKATFIDEFTSEPFDEPLDIVGFPRAILHLSSSAPVASRAARQPHSASGAPTRCAMAELSSIDGVEQHYCLPPSSTTCQGIKDTRNIVCTTSDDCGLPELDDGDCPEVGDGAGLCSYACAGGADCTSQLECTGSPAHCNPLPLGD